MSMMCSDLRGICSFPQRTVSDVNDAQADSGVIEPLKILDVCVAP